MKAAPVFTFLLVATPAAATPVTGKLELPPAPERPAVITKGFIDRVENPKKNVQGMNVAPQLLVVLEGEPKTESTAQVTWELVGESFGKPVIGVPAGAEIVIRNTSRTARTLAAAENPGLIPPGPSNASGGKTFKAPAAAGVFTIGDKDAPHLRGKLVVVTTPHIANVDAAGKFDLGDVPEGTYKLRVFYKDNWIDRPDQTVAVPAKGKVDINDVKIPAGFPLKK
ncbi:MAG: hypothetical protein ABI867_04555 [Kofleriaceae bacterium]